MSQLILESLDKNRLDVFNKLRTFKGVGILGGGTSLSLQIGHRVSYDFDIFTHGKFPRNLWKDVTITFGKNCQKLLDFDDQLNLVIPNGVNITFFHDDYKHLFTPVKSEPIDLMNVKDIACNKAYIIGKRPKWRDYVDLYFLLRDRHILFDELIHFSKTKFGSDFSERLFLQQLVYWDDITDYKIEFLGDEVHRDETKSFLWEQVKTYKNSYILADK